MIVNIVMDREIEKKNIAQKKQDGFNKEHNIMKSETRVMYFVGDSTVDAGGRFTGLPEKLPLSAESFMQAFEQGVKNSIIGGISEEEIAKRKETEQKEIKATVEKTRKAEKEKKAMQEETDKKKQMIELFQLKVKELNSAQLEKVKEVNIQYNVTAETFKDVTAFPMEALDKYMDILREE